MAYQDEQGDCKDCSLCSGLQSRFCELGMWRQPAEAVAIAVRGIHGRRRWSKLKEWLTGAKRRGKSFVAVVVPVGHFARLSLPTAAHERIAIRFSAPSE
jgi:hypothetical protein